jgi:uncharacterized protein (TIGR03032 family)
MNNCNLTAWCEVVSTHLIVSTYWNNQIIVITNGKLVKVGFDRPKGIYYRSPELKIATWANVWTYREYTDPNIIRQIDPNCDAVFIPKKFEETGNIGSREIAGDFIAASKLSCLVKQDDRYSVLPTWKPKWIDSIVAEDRCHVNGIALSSNGEPAYVTALGTGNKKESWRSEPVAGCIIDIKTGRAIVDNLRMPHSPRLYGNHLWVCDSLRGELSIIDVKTRKRYPFVKFPEFVRGLAFWNEWAIVGLSKMRYSKGNWGASLGRCGLAAVNLNTAKVEAVLDLPANEIFDVQVLPFKNPVIVDPRSPILDSLLILPTNDRLDIKKQYKN